ncbi:glycosyltransferase family 8 protein [Pantoea stewartii subsp. indologenes]|nr:glycosyltransferase family 8 protein [Pantoea stewartii]MDK2632377.1 glycosyltransferase family 8 protein [Pantoea stewartii subsp. indologenes]
MFAWVTLLTQPDYLVGVKALHRSLQQTKTRWPLLVMATNAISDSECEALRDEGCLIRRVDPLYPDNDLNQHYASERFGEVWTKLRAWQLTEYRRVVFLDADMLILKNMDELFTLDLGDFVLAACHACRCNPNQIESYPDSWEPEFCHYTWQEREQTPPAHVDYYLNGGFLVLEPDETVFNDLEARIAAIDDLRAYAFSEQDLLNEAFKDKWLPLSYIYNALKTLRFQHDTLWECKEVKNLHYILAKPWERDLSQPVSQRDRYYAMDKLWWDKASDC